jgi:hypothetical protein
VTVAANAPEQARPDPRRVWVYRGYRDRSRLIGVRGRLDVVDRHGAVHSFEDLRHLVLTTTSHLGARGSVWREPRLLGTGPGGAVRLSMRCDAYRPDDVRRVAAAVGLRYDERAYFSVEKREQAHPPAPDCVMLDVASRTVKLTLVISLVVLTCLVLAALVAVVEAR